MRLAAIFALFLAATLCAAERINVSVCNLGHLPESLVAQAEMEAETVFRSMNIQVVWAKCQDEVATGEVANGSRFVIRLRSDRQPKTAGQASLDAMGRTYLGSSGNGFMADIYYVSVHEFAEQHNTDMSALFGHVMVHELGHLLLGPGHSPHGIMHSPWKRDEAVAANQLRLKFTAPQQEKIHQNVRKRTAR